MMEAIIVGISTVLIGLLGYHSQHANSPTMKKEMMQLVILLFLTGFFHIYSMNSQK